MKLKFPQQKIYYLYNTYNENTIDIIINKIIPQINIQIIIVNDGSQMGLPKNY